MTEEERKLTIDYLEDMKEECVEGEGNEKYPLPEWYLLDKVIKIIEQQPSESEEIIKVSKGAVKARTGRYVIYDVEWLKTHFNTTEAKIYGQPQPKERTEERTEMHECDKKECWIEHKGTFKPHIECPKCGVWFLREDLPRNSYCPNCGSRNHWEWELKLDGGKKE